MTRYLLRWLVATLLLIGSVAVFNVVIDPYGIFRLVDRPGLNAIKPTATTRGGMAKAYGVLREQPGVLILGNSRAEVGFDPAHPAWPANARPAFNLSIAGTGPTTTLRYFQHALATSESTRQEIQAVVWGIDFMDFLVRPDERADSPRTPTVDEGRLLERASDLGSATDRVQSARDWADSSLTMRALSDSLQTLASQRDPNATDQTPLGFNPMRDYLRIARDEGYWNIFNQKDQTYVRSFMNRPKGIFDARGDTSKEFEAARAILRLCRERGIALKLVMYPYHAHFQEAFRITGHWPAFELWKRQVVRMVADEARTSGQAPFPVWDFTGFSPWTTELVPPRGDRQSRMRWYWEAGHFKKELGDKVLDRIWGLESQIQGFGVRLDESNVEAVIARVRTEEQDYRSSHPDVIRALEAMLGRPAAP